MVTLESDVTAEKCNVLVVRTLDSRGKPVGNVNVKVFRLEKKPITVEQWTENLRNGAPFKRLMLSKNSDDQGNVTAEFAEGSYEIKVEEFSSIKTCELTQNEQVVFVEPKKHWWQ